jgi:uncharacterized CHY-type Zn-finger protein
MATTGSNIPVSGLDLDLNTRCLHYRSQLDVIAIKMRCCETYYACIDCHTALAGHEADVWPGNEWDLKAVLCGVCGAELSVNEYMGSGDQCPSCAAPFNPGCRKHYHLYFEVSK